MMNINKPKKITAKFLSVLPERSCDVLVRRFGLGDDSEMFTLESIGQDYGITRERVRQIENNALKNIRKSDVFEIEKSIFEELKDVINSLGGIVSEEDLLNHLSKEDKVKNHFNFILVLGDYFTKEKETSQFKSRWHIDSDLANQIHQVLDEISSELTLEDLYPEDEMINLFADRVGNIYKKYNKDDEVLKRWLRLSKQIDKNHFNEWGLSLSTNISEKGIRDYAYLSVRQHGSPMHFREVAKAISNNFNRKAHTATCHNELIKDDRFVLVGRGLYALSEWGYSRGVVKEVIKDILKKDGALTREEIIEKVLKERYIKENTVVVNLQDMGTFKRDNRGKYMII